VSSALRRRLLALALATSIGSGVVPARAQHEDAAIAEKLFLDGRAAMARGAYADACPMLAESHRIDPGVGTLLSLGECYEKQGKTASAWATYREAEPMARRLGQKERAAHAAARAEALSAKLSYVTVRMATQPRGLTLTLDDKPLAPAAWSTPIPVDPGPHVVTAAAPGRTSRSTSVEVTSMGRSAVDLPELDASPASPASGEPAPGAGDRGATQRTIGWAGVVVGGLAIGTGVAFGLTAKSKNDEADTQHCSSAYCDPRGVSLIGDAQSAALVSTTLFVVGAAALAAGVVIVITAPTGKRIAIAPYGAGATVAAAW